MNVITSTTLRVVFRMGSPAMLRLLSSQIMCCELECAAGRDLQTMQIAENSLSQLLCVPRHTVCNQGEVPTPDQDVIKTFVCRTQSTTNWWTRKQRNDPWTWVTAQTKGLQRGAKPHRLQSRGSKRGTGRKWW